MKMLEWEITQIQNKTKQIIQKEVLLRSISQQKINQSFIQNLSIETKKIQRRASINSIQSKLKLKIQLTHLSHQQNLGYSVKIQKAITDKSKDLDQVRYQSGQIRRINQDLLNKNGKLKQDLVYCQQHLQNILKHNAFIHQEMQNYIRQDQAIINVICRKRDIPMLNNLILGALLVTRLKTQIEHTTDLYNYSLTISCLTMQQCSQNSQQVIRNSFESYL